MTNHHSNDGLLDFDVRVPLDRFELRLKHSMSRPVLGIFGVSGSGKTTFLETIAGLRRQAQGTIRFGGEIWMDSERNIFLPPERRRIGYVPQDHLLFPNRTVRGNLESGRQRAVGSGGDFTGLFQEVAGVLELQPLLDRSIRDLSGGERQRVALGRALCSSPQLLLLDEPLASLDQRLRHRILPLLQRVRDRFQIPILLVSHNPIEVQALCEELIVLSEGQKITAGPPARTLALPEVLQTAEGGHFENLLIGRVSAQEEHTTRMVMEGSDGELEWVVPKLNAEPGSQVFLSLAAGEIILSTTQPEGISARNRIPAVIESISQAGHLSLVTVLPGGKADRPLIVELTAEAVEELKLKPGDPVFLLVKTNSIRTSP